MIKRIAIKNFKSLDVDFALDPVTVLVGKSGTGKTNVVEALRFARDFLRGKVSLDWPMVSATAADENTLSFLFEAGEIAHHRSGPHRACKEWLTRNRREGYKPTRHQKALTGTLDLERVARRMRSFRRLETAVQEIIAATRAHRHIVSPTP